jgi:deoxyribonuclease-4
MGREARALGIGMDAGGGTPPPVPRLGMHVSIAGGLEKMAERARSFGCESVQVFSRSPRGGPARVLAPGEVAGCRRVLEEAGVRPLVVHVPYFINLCAADEGLRAYAVESLAGEFARAARLGAAYVVTHLGRPGEGVAAPDGLALAAASVAEAFRQAGDAGGPAGKAAGGVRLLLENTAGSGREIGWRLEELAELLVMVDRASGGRTGICLDTCHAHAAGYDLGGPEGVAAFARRARELFGAGQVRVVHANDALEPAGSHLDRHAAIGAGTIGEAGFSALLAETLFRDSPFLLETPGSDEERALDLVRLRRIRAGEPLGAA